LLPEQNRLPEKRGFFLSHLNGHTPQQRKRLQRVTTETPLNRLSDIGLYQLDGMYPINHLTA